MPNIFQRNVMASGVIPQISAIFGPCAGGAVYSPALTDFIIMKKETSNMFLTGPKVVKTVTGEDVTQEQLGGATMHTTKSGVAQFAVDTEEEGIELIRKLHLLHAAEQHGGRSAGRLHRRDRPPGGLAQRDHPRQRQQTLRHGRGHPCRSSTTASTWSRQARYAKNIITCFARFNGQSVGIVANQPKFMAGVLDINASAARRRVSSASAMRSTFRS